MKASILAIATLISFTANAGNGNENPVELKYIGNQNNQPVFQLNLTPQSSTESMSIIIKDDAGNTLFSDNVKGSVFSKKFLLNAEQTEDETIRVDVTTKSGNKQVTYLINTQTRQITQTEQSKF
jgi:hypothetical protein